MEINGSDNPAHPENLQILIHTKTRKTKHETQIFRTFAA